MPLRHVVPPLVGVLFIFGSVAAVAQPSYHISSIEIENERWVLAKDIPKDKMIKGYVNYRFYAPPCEDANIIELYGETNKGGLVQIKTWENKCVFYPEKSDRTATFKNERLVIHSELSYKSTSINCVFKFKGNSLEFSGLEINDSNADLMYTGDSLLLMGDVEEAIATYNKIYHPGNYMNMTGKGIEILEVAYPLALEAAEAENFERAARLMDKALGFSGVWMLAGDAFVNMAELEKYQKELWKNENTIQELIEMYTVDYGYFLYKSGKITESITLNRYLSNILTHCATPCLYWADALYDTGKTEQAKQPYRMYMLRMKSQDREEEIVERATKRAN